MSEKAQPKALDGIRVLELGRVLAAPFCAMMLGDLGADVVKVELPGTGDEARSYGPPFMDNGEAVYFLSLNRNKKSVTLNLKHEAAKDLLRRLITRSDVFLHNSVPGPMERLGFSYEQVRQVNPRIIYCAISGFGQSGPYRDKPGLDILAQALSGIMSLTGEPDGPPVRAYIPVSDLAAASFAAFAIVSALFHRERTGQGQMVDTSLLGSSVAMLSYIAGRYFHTGEVPGRLGNAHPTIVPYDAFPAGDGYVTIAVVNDPTWERFCGALGLQSLATDQRFATNPERVRNRAELHEILVKCLASYKVSDLVGLLDAVGVPAAEVRDVAGAFAHPQVQHLGMRLQGAHPVTGEFEVPGFPYGLSETPPAIHRPPPRLGEHNAEVLGDLGLTADDIRRLRDVGAI